MTDPKAPDQTHDMEQRVARRAAWGSWAAKQTDKPTPGRRIDTPIAPLT